VGSASRAGARMVKLGCAVVALACGSGKPLPPYLSQAGVDHPRFPRVRYISAVGISGQSGEDAGTQAKRAVSERISSQLRAETESFQSATSAGGSSSEAQRITSRVSTTTSFDRADLIDIVERQESEGSWYALGVLDRAKADGEIARAHQSEIVSFLQFSESALLARQQARPGDFNTSRQKAMKLVAGLDASFIVRRAVLGHPSTDEEKFLERRNQLLRAVAEADSRKVVQVRIEGVDSPTLLKLAVSAVRKLGLRVAETKTCAEVDQHPEDATELVVLPEEACSEGSLGEKCEVAVRLHARGCVGGGEGEGRTPLMRGVHPSDRARARNSAWNKVTSDTVESAVGEALRGAQVVDEGATR
jgi:hypothetical protein